MKTKNKKTDFPFMTTQPRNMTVLEQVVCMVWVSQNHTLKELRERQTLIELQQDYARKQNLSNSCRENLSMMSDNTAASVAYKSFTEPFWVQFINV